jgi:GntR family transcriptional regulator, histidine utilization repressor
MGDGLKQQRQKPTTMHARIMREIKQRISSGLWAPGHKIPYETRLAADFGVSRATMNKVLTQLTRAGLLERRRKLGTIVRVPQVQLAVLAITEISDEAKMLGSHYGYRLLSRSLRKPHAGDLQKLGTRGVMQVLVLTCLHYADDAPFCVEERLVNLTAVPDAKAANFLSVPPSTWLLAHVPWSSAKHAISARLADQSLAKHLAIKSGAACLVIERVTENKGEVITHTRLTYPGDKHQMVAEFKPPTL